MPIKIKILILGGTGMLCSQVCKYFYNKKKYATICVVRSRKKFNLLNSSGKKKIKATFLDLQSLKKTKKMILKLQPDYLINCVGMVKQIMNKQNKKETFFLNTKLPKVLSDLAKSENFKFIHFSTDCVFSGKRGHYRENDVSDYKDYYGKTKYLGENDSINTINLRTSIIGHELNTKIGLLEWFLSSKKKVFGFKNAIFSGLTTLEIAKILDKHIINKNVIKFGTFHISSKPINKYNLLKMISKIYKKDILIVPNYNIKCNRALNSSKFKKITGYNRKNWNEMLIELRKNYLGNI